MRARMAIVMFVIAMIGLSPALANELDVPVIEYGEAAGQLPTCSTSTVSGLNPQGDGFLAVRSGPGSQFRKIDELYNGEIVYVYEQRGDWAGIVYRDPSASCVGTRTRPVPNRNKGWVHTNWLEHLAG